MKLPTALSSALMLSLIVFVAGCTAPKTSARALHFDYVASVSEVVAGAKKVDIWIPVPQDDESQKISQLEIKAPGKHRLTTEKVYGNRMVYVSLEAPFPEKAEVRVSFDVERLEVSSVSNWGGYGLVAALSLLKGKNMLPTVDHETKLIKQLVHLGLVDGTTGDATHYVDGFTTEENGTLLGRLHQLVDGRFS